VAWVIHAAVFGNFEHIAATRNSPKWLQNEMKCSVDLKKGRGKRKKLNDTGVIVVSSVQTTTKRDI